MHNIHAIFNIYLNCDVKRTKIKQKKRPGMDHLNKNKLKCSMFRLNLEF